MNRALHGARVLAAGIVALVVLLSAVPGRAEDAASEAALRRRVQRFHVLSFLNRHGEMWELFSVSLQERLGNDRKAYVRDARGTGFELYQSQVESISIEDSRAVVDVRLQVQLPGAMAPSWREHRMVWRLEEGAWCYAGSKDVTREEAPRSPMAAELEALPGTGMGLAEPGLLPSPAANAPLAASIPSASAKAAPAQPAPLTTERWDLVAIPPEGRQPPIVAEAEAATPTTAATLTPTPAAPPPAIVVPSQIAAASPDASLLPPEQAAPRELMPPRAAETARARDGSSSADEESISETVRKAAEGNPLRRLRALARLRTIHDPRVVGLMTAAIADAPFESQALFLSKLAELGGPEHLPLALARLSSEAVAVRAAAAAAVGELGTAANEAAVGALVGDSRADVRVAALTALGRLGGAPGPLLSPILLDGNTSSDELVAAADAAGLAHALDCETALLAIVDRGTPALAVGAAMEALGRLATPDALRKLTALLSDRSVLTGIGLVSPTRLLAARALALSGSSGSGMSLARTLRDFPDASSAADADLVAATGEWESLLVLLGHGRSNVRRRAAELAGRSLEAQGDRAQVAAALQAARNVETDDRTLVALQAALERLRADVSTASATLPR